MAPSRLGALALVSLTVASAFQNTSPLFLFSTSAQLEGLEAPVPQIATSSHVRSQLEPILSKCTAKNYVVVAQPAVQASDYISGTTTPHLRRWAAGEDEAVRSMTAIPEVIGGIDANFISDTLKANCKADVVEVDAADGYISFDDRFPRVVRVTFKKLSTYDEERAAGLVENDSFLNAIVSSLHSPNYTIIYTTTPPSPADAPQSAQEHGQVYEMDDSSTSALHTDLKRDVSARASKNPQTTLPLFEAYMFLSPGMFMALTVAVPLLLILYVAISAVAGLEVSYFAFSKEMGPAAQKKLQ